MQVFYDGEMQRILALPRKTPWTPDRIEEAVAVLTKAFKTPNGTQKIKPEQAQALVEAHDTGRLVGLLGAGSGKTLVAALLPTVLNAKRALYLVPAFLRTQSFDVWKQMAQHWNIRPLLDVGDRAQTGHPTVRILSYESLGSVSFASFLEEYDPDLVIADEAHMVSRRRAGRTKRLFRFVKNKRLKHGFHSVRYVPLSGTLFSRSIRDATLNFEAALGSEGSPLPTEYVSQEAWCSALDEGLKDEVRYKPGALLRLLPSPIEKPELEDVRKAVRDRIVSAPGVVATSEVSCSLPLIIQRRHVEVPAKVRSAIKALREENTLPSGMQSELGVVKWSHLRELATGFAYRMDPPPPKEWKQAKNKWISFVQETLKRNPNMDTPLQVWQAVESGKFGVIPEWVEWVRVKDTFEPNTVPDWISDYLIKDAEAWALANNGIVWVGHATAYTSDDTSDDGVGAGFTQIPYFGSNDDRIKTYKGPCAASIKSHGTGKNLTQWSEALILNPLSGGKATEQLFARHHREKQQADFVRFHVYLQSKENKEALSKAIKDAAFLESITGQTQRLNFATLLDVDGHVLDLGKEEDLDDPMWG